MDHDFLSKRTQILQQMAALDTMEQGSLKAEYRDSPSGERCGPYFKHQAWQEGTNVSRRVPAEEAPALEAAIANRQKFEALATEFIDLTVSGTRQSLAAAEKKERRLRPRPARRDCAVNRGLLSSSRFRAGGAAVGSLDPHGHFQTGHPISRMAIAAGGRSH